MTRNSNTYYYTFDGLGSVSELTDSTGAVTEAYKYDAFGNLQTPPATGNPYTYTSREYDAETGLYFYRARYYDAQVGRFITADPIGFEGGVNFYVYVNNDPINYIDPEGYLASQVPVMPIFPPISGPTINTTSKPIMHEKKSGKWTVLIKCNVHPVKDCAKCPERVEGQGSGPSFPIAKLSTELNAKAMLAGTIGCQTKHCHPIRCWKDGNPVPCPGW